MNSGIRDHRNNNTILNMDKTKYWNVKYFVLLWIHLQLLLFLVESSVPAGKDQDMYLITFSA